MAVQAMLHYGKGSKAGTDVGAHALLCRMPTMRRRVWAQVVAKDSRVTTTDPQVEEKYRNHFREHLDAEGNPVNVQRPGKVNTGGSVRYQSSGSKNTWLGCWCRT